jgi:cephalosporin hydroxylase
MNLLEYFLNNKGKSIHKWKNYFPVYEKHFSPWKDKSPKILEIGVDNGGSVEMWQAYFGSSATIVGIDINPKCAEHAQAGIEIRIGDQSDPKFLQQLVDEFGMFDIIIDDGSHRSDHIKASFDFLYSKVKENGCYFIEDLHMTYSKDFGDSMKNSNSFINYSKSLVDYLTADHERCPLEPNSFTRDTFCISFYDSIIVFDKMPIPVNTAVRIPNK